MQNSEDADSYELEPWTLFLRLEDSLRFRPRFVDLESAQQIWRSSYTASQTVLCTFVVASASVACSSL